jgi:uncharacterized membrane protein (UPF0127 family)
VSRRERREARRTSVLVFAAAVGVVLVLVSAAIWKLSGSDGGGVVTASALDPTLAGAKPAVTPFRGLTEVELAIDGDCHRVAVADTDTERQQGLRSVTDLSPYDGMLFVYTSASLNAYTMADTLIPLDIGFYDAQGEPVDRLKMVPCSKTQAECPLYQSKGPFFYALETPHGHLAAGPIGGCPS